MTGKVVELEGLRFYAQTVSKIEATKGGMLLPPGPASIVHPLGNARFLHNGWHSWAHSGWVGREESWLAEIREDRWPQVDDPVYFSKHHQGGSGMGALEGSEGKILFLGALGVGARVEVERDVLWGSYEGEPSKWFLSYGNEDEIFSRYADLLGERFGKGVQLPPPRVWCSWYSFYRDINEIELLMVLGDLEGLPFDVIQVDDGWQRDIGDWQTNDRFPRGMDFLAKEIRRAGFKPGIWLAPFIVRPTSALFHKHADWILKDKHGEQVVAGRNWGGPFYSLDITHPQVLSWLQELIREVRSWGYEYFKLDFLYAGAMPGNHFNPISREVAYRKALSVLREETRGRYLLACGAPVLASIGLCDGMRVGPDVAPYWRDISSDLTAPGAGNAIRTTLHRLWLRPLVHTDPDVVFFRTRYNLLSHEQKQLLQDLAQIAGFKSTSDLPKWLDPEELKQLESFFKESPACKRVGRYQYLIGNREVDFKNLIREIARPRRNVRL